MSNAYDSYEVTPIYEDAYPEGISPRTAGLALPPVSPTETHFAILLLVDVSSSVSAHIDDINVAVGEFINAVKADPYARRRADLAIVTFGGSDEVKTVQDFRPVCQSEAPRLQANGCTPMGAGVKKAVTMTIERGHMYDDMGTPKHTPWVVVISDGAPTDEYKEAFALAHQREEDGRLATWFIGTPGFSESVALDLTPRVLKLANHDYSEFFKWLAQNTKVISVTHTGTTPQVAPLPEALEVVERPIPNAWYANL